MKRISFSLYISMLHVVYILFCLGIIKQKLHKFCYRQRPLKNGHANSFPIKVTAKLSSFTLHFSVFRVVYISFYISIIKQNSYRFCYGQRVRWKWTRKLLSFHAHSNQMKKKSRNISLMIYPCTVADSGQIFVLLNSFRAKFRFASLDMKLKYNVDCSPNSLVS